MTRSRRSAWLEGIEAWPLSATVEICCAVAAGIAALAAWTDGLRGELFGVTVGVHAIIILYWILFPLLFKTGLTETMWTVAILIIIQGLVNIGIWKA